jgi:hypothetical protein
VQQATPQRRRAIKARGLKKPDREADFFCIAFGGEMRAAAFTRHAKKGQQFLRWPSNFFQTRDPCGRQAAKDKLLGRNGIGPKGLCKDSQNGYPSF